MTTYRLTAYSFPLARLHIERALRNHASLPAYRDLLQALQHEHVRGDLHEVGANYYSALQRELEDLAEGREVGAANGSTWAARRAAARAALDMARPVSDAEIRALRSEADGRDSAQVELCDLALWVAPAGQPIDRALARRSGEARAKCGAALANARVAPQTGGAS